MPRLLIVDDQKVNVRIMSESLREYELVTAETGAAALELAQAGGIDLILLDVGLPDIDGFEICRRLKADDATRAIPVIFVTAHEDIAHEAKGFAAGAVDYITKPIRPPIVRARVGTQLELKRSRDLLARLASIDGLTGIGNRRHFDEALEREWRRARRTSAPLSIAMIDVDHFKHYNDTHGHAGGDECLRVIAAALVDVVQRAGDTVARYGGEEFALILPDTDRDAMAALAERILAAIRRLKRTTVSIGAATVIADGDDPHEALARADAALYEAKSAGRDRFVSA